MTAPAAAVPLADRCMKARRRGICGLCGAPTLPGQRIARIREHGYTRWPHAACLTAMQRGAAPRRPVADVYLPGDRPAR